ncbi:GNAT family N-acetyltransferase [Micromonospora terminaliae]|uniref:GNAT family N-acetyltransferase n=1 Tax=Micromonospora terminaliae TaxID=1914461 RepID=A0AAJ2ZEL8_9ACTN|nr:GNAT family N-acetyltransferase [Micromonospora terminaliae]NES28221.1 GNAT family N-acetyltransferase [Micromonospora terminaliae]QGL46034.1 GNAT family N-acetyltransferase [Micromonospora terminaliae]
MALWRIRATVDDRPGYLSVLTASLALRGVNILTVQVHTTELGAVDDFLVDAPDRLTEADLRAAVERGRGRNCWVARSEARGLADQPTRVLGLAGRLVRDPDAAGETLRVLLGADAVTWRPTAAAPPGGVDDTTMLLADPAGGSYELRRREPTFTPAEYARAQALVELAATVARRDADRVTLVLPDTAEVPVRPATADDLPGVLELHAGCSDRSRRRRYLSGAQPASARLRRLLEPARGLTLVATAGGAGAPVVAMANLLGEGDEAEAALLVRDDWQRRGLGSALLRRLLGHADRAGYAAVLLHVQAENTPMLRTVRRLDRPTTVQRDGGVVTVTVPLAPGPARVPGQADVTVRARRSS